LNNLVAFMSLITRTGDGCTNTDSNNWEAAPTRLWKGQCHRRGLPRANAMADSISVIWIGTAHNRSWGYQTLQLGVWSRPIQSQHSLREVGNKQLLQLVLLHLHICHDHISNHHCVCPNWSQLGLGIGNPCVPHVPVLCAFLHGFLDLRQIGTRRESFHQCDASPSGCSQEKAPAFAGPAMAISF